MLACNKYTCTTSAPPRCEFGMQHCPTQNTPLHVTVYVRNILHLYCIYKTSSCTLIVTTLTVLGPPGSKNSMLDVCVDRNTYIVKGDMLMNS